MTSRESEMVVIETDEAGIPIIWCDPEIVDLVRALNTHGLSTVASCSGHGEKQFGIVSLKDGRELLVMPDYETTRKAERILGGALKECPELNVLQAEFVRGREFGEAGAPVVDEVAAVFALRALVAAGYVTQAKVDHALELAMTAALAQQPGGDHHA